MHDSIQHTPSHGRGVPRRRRALPLLAAVGAMSLGLVFAGQTVAQAAPGDEGGGWSRTWDGDRADRWDRDDRRDGGERTGDAATEAAAPAAAPVPAPAPAPAPAPVQAPAPTGSGTQAYQDYALSAIGGDTTQLSCLVALWNAESGWNPDAQNPTSTAYGIAQFLDSTWAGTGIAKTSDPFRQIDAGLIYIENRYGSPCAAWSFHQANNWY